MYFIILLMTVLTDKSGTIPMHEDKIIMVDSHKHPGMIVLPKGKVKDNESYEKAAIRETEEEAGVRGELKPTIYMYKNTIYFVLSVKELLHEYDEKNRRNRHSFTLEEIGSRTDISDSLKRFIKKVLNNK